MGGLPRFAVVGGGIRGAMFATAVQQHPDADLVSICDPVEPVRHGLSSRLAIPGYARAEEMLDGEQLDAVIVATPDFAHHDVAVLCAGRGLHLLMEKPLATTSAEAEAIVDAADSAGARIMIGFENRWNPRFAEVQAQLQSGEHGMVVNQVAHLNDTIFVPTRMLSWAGKSSPAWFLMPHSLDLAIWLSAARPVEVFARGVRRVLVGRGIDTWDAISASFEMSDGSLLTLESQWVLPETAPAVFDFRFEVHTDRSSFRLNVSDTGVRRDSQEGVSWLQFGVYERNGRLYGVPIDMVDDFIAVVNGAAIDVPDGRHGLLVTRAIEAVHRSLDSGRPQPVPDAA